MKFHRALIMFFSSAGCAGCDQSTKFIARAYLDGKPQISLWNDLVRLELVENSGAFLSLGASLPENVRTVIFLAIVPVILLTLVVYALTSRTLQNGEVWMAGLIVGGGLGNVIDRVLNDGRVTDFLNVGIGWLRTGVFNVADVVLLFASIYLVLFMNQSTKTEQSD